LILHVREHEVQFPSCKLLCMKRKVTFMDINQLRQLEALAQHGTMSAAANACNLSQSAFSRSIQRLESELGAQLFDRQKNSVHLNGTRGRRARQKRPARGTVAPGRRR